jgi:hypothetical protein
MPRAKYLNCPTTKTMWRNRRHGSVRHEENRQRLPNCHAVSFASLLDGHPYGCLVAQCFHPISAPLHPYASYVQWASTVGLVL